MIIIDIYKYICITSFVNDNDLKYFVFELLLCRKILLLLI